MCGMTPPSEVRIVSSTGCVLTLKSFSGIDTCGGSGAIDGVLSLCNNCAILIRALFTDSRGFGDSTSLYLLIYVIYHQLSSFNVNFYLHLV